MSDVSDSKQYNADNIQVLEGLDRDVEITAFFGELDAPPIRDLLEKYSFAS